MDIRESLNRLAASNPLAQKLAARLRPRHKVFGKAYETQAWASAESGSSSGSEMGATETIRPFLRELFDKYDIKSFLDAPCGDWNWMQHVDLSGLQYVGADVVQSVIDSNSERHARPGVLFLQRDLTKDPLPKVDMIMCRDCWIHVSFEDIAGMLENFRRSGARWLLVNTSPHITKNLNQLTSLRYRYHNLSLAPFNFPEPVEMRRDNYPSTDPADGENFYFSQIALYRIADLPKLDLRGAPLKSAMLASSALPVTEAAQLASAFGA